MRTQLPRASRLMAITRVPVIIAFAFWTRPLHSAEVGNYMGLVSASYSEFAAIPTELAWTARHHNVHEFMGEDARRIRTIASQIRNVALLRRGHIAQAERPAFVPQQVAQYHLICNVGNTGDAHRVD